MDQFLTPQLVFQAYQQGYFPMADIPNPGESAPKDKPELGWYIPYHRALFPMEGIRVSRSLAKTIRQHIFEIRFDTAFESVMRSCLRPEDNWISEEIIEVYTEIHHQGWGHCSECWSDGELVGGVYGIAIGGCFFAESMFHRKTDASKVALWAIINRCRDLRFTIFDAQIMNPHLKSLGAFSMPNAKYQRLLRQALLITTQWSPVPPELTTH